MLPSAAAGDGDNHLPPPRLKSIDWGTWATVFPVFPDQFLVHFQDAIAKHRRQLLVE